VQREINLDGGEISVLKAIGVSGAQMPGRMLLERAGDMEPVELADSISGLMALGYVLSTKTVIRDEEDIEKSIFRVNPSYARDLRDALRPGGRREEKSRRRRV
jgi:hypothetical protein